MSNNLALMKTYHFIGVVILYSSMKFACIDAVFCFTAQNTASAYRVRIITIRLLDCFQVSLNTMNMVLLLTSVSLIMSEGLICHRLLKLSVFFIWDILYLFKQTNKLLWTYLLSFNNKITPQPGFYAEVDGLRKPVVTSKKNQNKKHVTSLTPFKC